MDEQRKLAVEDCGETPHDLNFNRGRGVAFSSELRVYCIIIRGSKKAEHNDEENDKRRVQ